MNAEQVEVAGSMLATASSATSDVDESRVAA
jgi:hypothetical protein